jgi:flagellar motor protein MotB
MERMMPGSVPLLASASAPANLQQQSFQAQYDQAQYGKSQHQQQQHSQQQQQQQQHQQQWQQQQQQHQQHQQQYQQQQQQQPSMYQSQGMQYTSQQHEFQPPPQSGGMSRSDSWLSGLTKLTKVFSNEEPEPTVMDTYDPNPFGHQNTCKFDPATGTFSFDKDPEEERRKQEVFIFNPLLSFLVKLSHARICVAPTHAHFYLGGGRPCSHSVAHATT